MSAEWVSAVATCATATIALVALIFAARQVSAAREQSIKASASQLDATAREAWKDYLHLAFANAGFADGKHGASEQEISRYHWFVAVTLDACELMQLYATNKDDWRASIKGELEPHKAYLNAEGTGDENFRPKYYNLYSEPMKSLIDEACGRNKKEVAA